MKALLVIIFLINGEPSILVDGYSPLEVELKDCDRLVEFTKNYIETVPDLEVQGVYCDTEENLQEKFNMLFLSIPT